MAFADHRMVEHLVIQLLLQQIYVMMEQRLQLPQIQQPTHGHVKGLALVIQMIHVLRQDHHHRRLQ
jgi:hypothetical protein